MPENPDKKIPGTLSIRDGGKIDLEVVGHFDGNFESAQDNTIGRIIGHIEKDEFVTLENCLYRTRNLSFGGISKSELLVHKCLIGAAWDKDEEIKFDTVSFSVDYLDEWIGITGIKIEDDWDNDTTTITYLPPKNISLPLDNGMRLEILFSYTLPGFPRVTEAKITQKAYFKLASSKPTDLKDFTKIAFKITNLMCFAMDDVVSMETVIGKSSEIVRTIGTATAQVPVKIYFQSSFFQEKKPKKSWHEMIFTFSCIEDKAALIFNKWINSYDQIHQALDLYFTTKGGAQKFLDAKFLALAQGLETYHRRTNNETLMSKDKYESLVSKIIEGCPEENREWLSRRLSHGNEISLSDRLTMIMEPFKNHIGTSRDRKRLVRKIVDNRNYLTHFDKSLEENRATGRNLWILYSRMEAIFTLTFLKLIGFDEEKIEMTIQKTYSLEYKLKLR